MKSVVCLVLLVITMTFVPLVSAQQTLQEAKNPAVWKINGDLLYAAEISLTMQNIAGQARQAGGQPPSNEELMEAATERMIEQKLLVQEANRLAVRVDEARLGEMIAAMEQQSGGRENLEKALAAGGTTFAQVVNLMRERELVMQLINTKIAPTIESNEADIKTYYEENPEFFTTEEQVRASHIIIEVKEDATDDVVAAAKLKAEKAHTRAVGGEDFAELAKELSEGPSASSGGDLGFFPADKMVAPFSEAISSMKPGEISGLVRTTFGFHVIKMEEIRPSGKLSFEEVHDRIAAVLNQDKIGATLTGLLETLRNNGTIEPVIPAGINLE